jgi:hypothetical protein
MNGMLTEFWLIGYCPAVIKHVGHFPYLKLSEGSTALN